VEGSIVEFVRFFKLLQISVWDSGCVLYKLRDYLLRLVLAFSGSEDCGIRLRGTGFQIRFVLRNEKSNLSCLGQNCLSLEKIGIRGAFLILAGHVSFSAGPERSKWRCKWGQWQVLACF